MPGWKYSSLGFMMTKVSSIHFGSGAAFFFCDLFYSLPHSSSHFLFTIFFLYVLMLFSARLVLGYIRIDCKVHN